MKLLFKLSACPRFKRTFGAIPQCEQRSDGHIVCNVTCRPGYSFIAGNTPLPEYTCGFNTSYVWNGEPPACGSIKDFFCHSSKEHYIFVYHKCTMKNTISKYLFVIRVTQCKTPIPVYKNFVAIHV